MLQRLLGVPGDEDDARRKLSVAGQRVQASRDQIIERLVAGLELLDEPFQSAHERIGVGGTYGEQPERRAAKQVAHVRRRRHPLGE